MKKDVPIVFLTDENYAIPTGVAIQSLLDHYHGNEKLTIVVICVDVSQASKDRFRRFASERVAFSLMDADGTTVQQFSEAGNHVTATTYVKFSIARLLPQYDRLLYLDGDILVQQDITELLAYEVDGYYIAAVLDMSAMAEVQWHRRLDRLRYFNAGVMLLNGSKLREENLEKKLFDARKRDAEKEQPEYLCMDQDVMNDVFDNRFKALPLRWNMMTYNMLKSAFTINQINRFYHTDYHDLNAMQDDAAILHLTNEYKPWKYKGAFMADAWMAVFRRCPFGDLRLNLLQGEDAFIVDPSRKQHQDAGVFSKRGIVSKEWTEGLTVIKIAGILVAEKHKENALTVIKIMGIPVAKRVWTDWEILTSVLDIRISRKLHNVNMKHRLDAYMDRINHAVDEAGAKADGRPPTYGTESIDRQLWRIEQMRAQYDAREKEV